MYLNKISGFADEISSDTTVQFRVLNKLGIEYFEPRGIGKKNISELTLDEAVELKSKMDSYGIKASSIGSPIGKVFLSDNFESHFPLFCHVVEIAKILDAKYIRIFSFYNNDSWNDEHRTEVIARLRRMIDYAKKENVVLLHENEKDIYGDSIDRCLDLMKALYCDNFKAVFDPANFVQCGENTIDAFKQLYNYIEYIHIKDSNTDGTIVPAGMGDGNIEEILSVLSKDGYNGFISLEPHLGSFEGLQNLELDDTMLNLPKAGEDTFTLAFRSLCEIINRINNKTNS